MDEGDLAIEGTNKITAGVVNTSCTQREADAPQAENKGIISRTKELGRFIRDLTPLQFGGVITTGVLYLLSKENTMPSLLDWYGADFGGGYLYYYFLRALGHDRKAGIVLTILFNAGYEIAQHQGAFEGTADPLDIAAALAGAGVAVGLEKVKERRRRKSSDNTEP